MIKHWIQIKYQWLIELVGAWHCLTTRRRSGGSYLPGGGGDYCSHVMTFLGVAPEMMSLHSDDNHSSSCLAGLFLQA